MAAVKKTNHTAAAAGAGYIFQLERALYHLSRADADASVAVEYVDDVAVLKDAKPILQEQDKHSVRPSAELLSDRSSALWRTLQIWLAQRSGGAVCSRYLIATKNPVTTTIAVMLKGVAGKSVTPMQVVQALRVAGKSNSGSSKPSKIQTVMNDVLGHGDAALSDLISSIEIVDAGISPDALVQIANGLGIDPRIEYEIVLEALLGWMTKTLQAAWRERQPGIISRTACLRQRYEIENILARQRLLPRPARDVQVAASDRTRAMARPFVHHLGRIEADEEDILQAIEHFIQFSTEKYRLAYEGEIIDREWRDRGDRLKQRWSNIVRSTKLEHRARPPQEIGQLILSQSTYHHLEPLGNQPCNELYMTSGHYHRLADDDEVWWDPTYQPERRK